MASNSGENKAGCSVSGSGGHKRTFNEMSADELKEEGNRHFRLKNYAKAVDCYSEAIAKNLKNPLYFTNRALAAFKMNRFDVAAADCRAALERDPILVKGHYYLGKGLGHLQRAVDLAMKKGDAFAGRALETLGKWHQAFEGNGLQAYMTRLTSAETHREIRIIQREIGREAEAEDKIIDVKQTSQTRLKEMNDLFNKLEEHKKNREVPDFLCCKITLDIFKDPVITPSGITYERVTIEEHLAKNGHVDPISGLPLTVDQLIPNLALKEAAAKFLEENEWAAL